MTPEETVHHALHQAQRVGYHLAFNQAIRLIAEELQSAIRLQDKETIDALGRVANRLHEIIQLESSMPIKASDIYGVDQ